MSNVEKILTHSLQANRFLQRSVIINKGKATSLASFSFFQNVAVLLHENMSPRNDLFIRNQQVFFSDMKSIKFSSKMHVIVSVINICQKFT